MRKIGIFLVVFCSFVLPVVGVCLGVVVAVPSWAVGLLVCSVVFGGATGVALVDSSYR
jgi:hypothetical protein